MKTGKVADLLRGIVVASAGMAWCAPAAAQASAGCGVGGYRVIASHWDAALRMNWEQRQDCAHPEWPTRLAAANSRSLPAPNSVAPVANAIPVIRPLLVRAGDTVRLWEQNATVRIEMSGVAEQSARTGERVVVRITRQNDDGGLTVDRITGVVRAADDVEIGQ